MKRRNDFSLPLSSVMSQLYGYIYSMLVSNVLVGMPLFGGALYLCGRAAKVLANVYSRKHRAYLPSYARSWGVILSVILLVIGILLMGLYPAGFQSPKVWIVFAAVALCLCADSMPERVRRLKRTPRDTSRRAWLVTILLQLLIIAGMGALLIVNLNKRTALEMTAAFALLMLIRAITAWFLYSGSGTPEEETVSEPVELLQLRAYHSFEVISLLAVTAIELTVSAIYALLVTGTESFLPAIALGIGCTLAAYQISLMFVRRTRKTSRQDPTWLLCIGLLLWLSGVMMCSWMLGAGRFMLSLVYICLALCSAGSTFCFSGLIKIDELMPGLAEIMGQSGKELYRKQRTANWELAQLLGDVLSLIALSVICFVNGKELPEDMNQLAARFQPVMIIPLLLVIFSTLISAFRFPLSARYIEKLRMLLQLKQSGEENEALKKQVEHVVVDPYRQPWLARTLIWMLRPFYRHTIINRDHIVTDKRNPLVFLGNHAEIYGPISCALYFPVPIRFWTISMMMGNRKDVRDYLYENTFRHKTFLPVFVRKALARLFGFLSTEVMGQLESIPVYRDSPIKLRQTLRMSIEALESGDNLMIFPENPDGKYQKGGIGEISPGFLMLAEAYWKKTGKKMRMMPVYANRENKTISFGQAILYNPENGFGKEQVRIVTETRAQILEMAGYPQEAAALREETETKTGEAEE